MLHLEINVKRRHIYALVAAVAVIVALLPLASYAADRFTDVPDSNVFHDDITWLADAGVTLGCNPPANDEFCPGDNVRRETMAAFMHRLAVNKVVDAKTAINAENAVNADVAAEADNADTLDGYEATELMPGGVVPVGATIYGAWAIAGAPATWISAGQPFGYSLPSAPVPHYLIAGSGPTTECPGTVAAPEALPGHLCVYEQLRNSIAAPGIFNASGNPGTASAFGFVVSTTGAAGGNGLAYGSWAVTAAAATPTGATSTTPGVLGQ